MFSSEAKGSMLQKMMRLTVFLLFLSCVFCLATGQTHSSYSKMEPRLKRFVDQALIKANQQFQYGHLNFYKIGEVKEQQPAKPWVRIDVRLKNTVCRKVEGANDHKHRPECQFRQLEVRCFVCRPDTKKQTGDPYIDCVRRCDQKKRYEVWDQNCLPQLHGLGSLLKVDNITREE